MAAFAMAERVRHPFLTRIASKTRSTTSAYNLAKKLRIKPWDPNNYKNSTTDIGEKAKKVKLMRLYNLGLILKGNQSKLKLKLAEAMIEKGIDLPSRGPIEVEPISTCNVFARAEMFDVLVDFHGFKYNGETHKFPSPFQVRIEK
jgi:hypothetical protein